MRAFSVLPTSQRLQSRPQLLTLHQSSASRKTGAAKKRNGGKWDQRTGNKSNSNNSGTARKGPPKEVAVRPVLTIYEENRNDYVNQQRLESSIGCEHFGSCPGCVVEENVGDVEIVESAKRYFSSTAVRRKRIDVIESGEDWVVEDTDDGFYKVVVPSDIIQWRTQAKLVVAPKSSSWAKDGCRFGLYQRRSHDVLDIPNCSVHHPSINQAVEVLEKATDRVGTAAYTEDSREGGLRYVQLTVERTTGKVCLTLVWAASDIKYAQPALSRLTKELTRLNPDLWHSMWLHCNDGAGNNIFTRNPKNWHRISGNEFLREPMAVGDQGYLFFSPLAFRQGNLDGFDVLANDVARAIPSGSRVCELYAGVGLLGITALTYHAKYGTQPLTWVRCSDENPANPRCFYRSVNTLPASITQYQSDKNGGKQDMTLGELMKMMESGNEVGNEDRSGARITYTVSDATAALRAGQALGASVLVVDPPRKGLEDEVLKELCKPFNPNQPFVESPTLLAFSDEAMNWTNDVQTLVYVSCGFDALARDSDRLLSSGGGWTLESATGYILFPGSNHVETLCIFQRSIPAAP